MPPTPSPTDLELLRRCRDGEGSAWEVLVGRYGGMVLLVAARHALAPDQADDVAQDTFFTLLGHLDEIETPERLVAWLRTTATRHSLKKIREIKMYRDRAGASLGVDDPESVDSDPERIRRLERANEAYGALDRLGDPCRDLLRRLYGPREQSYDEISRELDMPVGSIGPTRARCLEKLKRLMDGASG